MFYYVKMVGDEPIIIENDNEIDFSKNFIIDPKNLYFLITIQTPQGMGSTPISATDNGLDNSNIIIISNNISLYAKLDDNNSLVKIIKQLKTQKSGIITPPNSGIITP